MSALAFRSLNTFHLTNTSLLIVVPAFERNTASIERTICIAMSFAFGFTCDLAGLSPRKVVEMPVGVNWQDEVPDWECTEVDEHPSNVNQLARRQQNKDGGHSQHKDQKDQGHRLGKGGDGRGRESDNQDHGQNQGHGQDDGADQLHQNDKLHREAEGTAQIPDQGPSSKQVVDSRVDPTTSLRQQDVELVGDDSLADSLGHKHHLAVGEVAEHERRQEAILSKKQQVLLVQRLDNVLRVFLDNFGFGDDWDPVVALASLEAVHAEASRQTGHTSKDRLEALAEMMGDVVLKDLNGRDPGLALVGNLGLATEAHDEGVIVKTVHQQTARSLGTPWYRHRP